MCCILLIQGLVHVIIEHHPNIGDISSPTDTWKVCETNPHNGTFPNPWCSWSLCRNASLVWTKGPGLHRVPLNCSDARWGFQWWHSLGTLRVISAWFAETIFRSLFVAIFSGGHFCLLSHTTSDMVRHPATFSHGNVHIIPIRGSYIQAYDTSGEHVLIDCTPPNLYAVEAEFGAPGVRSGSCVAFWWCLMTEIWLIHRDNPFGHSF